ncbi:amidohydrolase family protein [Thiolinea disciformis]|uniref:amidohydrolase family protein n=1 Tax=Thiolinea disciformis TaxID=125614 RepID=UPI00036AE0DD|nr:amidohydrolase family protein [Thiolinea disciformis]
MSKTLVIDCHGHYTTAPDELGEYREQQKKDVKTDPLFEHVKGVINISDDQIRDSLEGAQLKLQRERGTDVAIFSPRASWMGHHIGNQSTSKYWTEHCNDLIYRITQLYPQNFMGAAQLPQSPKADMQASAKELERCVTELGFVGCNLSPDPSGGHWTAPRLDDRYWYPIYEKMCELDVPAMIHVSASCHHCFDTTGSHYLGADTTAFQHYMMAKTLFKDFPNLKLIIPHGGGAVPYHWGRFRGLADMLKLPNLNEIIKDHIYFDTCVYHQEGIDLLLDVVPIDNILFASEMIGAVRGIDPQTGHYFDDTKRYIDGSRLSAEDKRRVFELNTRRVFPRLDARLQEVGLL